MKRICLVSMLVFFTLCSMFATADDTGVAKGQKEDGAIISGTKASSKVSYDLGDLLEVVVGFSSQALEDGYLAQESLDMKPRDGSASGEVYLIWSIAAPDAVNVSVWFSAEGPLKNGDNVLNWVIKSDDLNSIDFDSSNADKDSLNIEVNNQEANKFSGDLHLKVSTSPDEDYRNKPAGSYSADMKVTIAIS